METLVIDFDCLASVVSHANNLAKKAEDYANDLAKKVAKKFDDIPGGSSTYTNDASYYVNSKITALQNKALDHQKFATSISDFSGKARKVDEGVAAYITSNKETFLNKHDNLRIEDWKANLLNWLVNLKNSFPILELIGDILRVVESAVADLFAELKYWYKCEGGKELVSLILAIGGVIVAALLLVAAFPVSGFIAICAAIGAVITLVNSVVNVVTSTRSLISANNDDPAWARIYGKQDKLTDVLRDHNFGNNGLLNGASYGAAFVIDATELFCNAVGIVDTVVNIKSKFAFVNNFFGKNTGLLSYCKTAKWKDAIEYDDFGQIIGKTKVLDVDNYGNVITTFTPSSIMRGLKAFVYNSPIDCRSEQGIRTILKSNLKIDFDDFTKSLPINFVKENNKLKIKLSLDSVKDTFKYYKYNKDELGTILFSKDIDKKAQAFKAFTITNVDDLKNLKNYAAPIKDFMNTIKTTTKVFENDYNLIDEIKGSVLEKSEFISVTSDFGDFTNDISKQWNFGKYVLN